MDLWTRSTGRAYAVAVLGMAAFDHLWQAVVPLLAREPSGPTPPEASEEMVRAIAAFDLSARAAGLFPWAEAAALFVVTVIAFRLRPVHREGDFYAYVVLVCLLITAGREAFGLHPAFTNPFGAKMVAAWLVVLCGSLVWDRIMPARR